MKFNLVLRIVFYFMIKIDMKCRTRIQGKHPIALACLAFLAVGIPVSGQDSIQDLAFSRRFGTTVFDIEKVTKKDPTKPAGAHGSVLIIFSYLGAGKCD